jgi:hypothetical protein
MRRQSVKLHDFRRTTKIGRVWGRAVKLEIGDSEIELAFVRHIGKYFSWRSWHRCLQEHHAGMMKWLGEEHYAP